MVKVCIFWEVVDLRTHSSLYSWDMREERGVTRQQKTGTHMCSLNKREQQISSWGTNWHLNTVVSLLENLFFWIQAYCTCQIINVNILTRTSQRLMVLLNAHTHKYIQVCRHTGRQITTRRGLACRQTDERRDGRTMMTAHHCCWWMDCEKDGWKWWNEETQMKGETSVKKWRYKGTGHQLSHTYECYHPETQAQQTSGAVHTFKALQFLKAHDRWRTDHWFPEWLAAPETLHVYLLIITGNTKIY